MKVRAWFNIASSVPLGASALSGVGNLGRGRNGFKAWRRHGPHHICPAMSKESSHKESSYTGDARPSAPQTPRPATPGPVRSPDDRSEEHTSELQSLMRISYAVFCLKKKKQHNYIKNQHNRQAHQ